MSTQDIWQGGTGDWNTPASWSTGSDPQSTQDAYIGLVTGSATVMTSSQRDREQYRCQRRRYPRRHQ